MDVLPETLICDLPGYDDLSSRAQNALAPSDIKVYRDLHKAPKDKLLSLRRCGSVTEAEISAWVKGLSEPAPERPAVVGVRTCCGERCNTQFCPHCGKELNTFGLVSLRGYCRKFQRQAEKLLQHSKDRLEKARGFQDNDVGIRVVENRVSADQRKYDKWSSWVAALDKILNSDAGGS